MGTHSVRHEMNHQEVGQTISTADGGFLDPSEHYGDHMMISSSGGTVTRVLGTPDQIGQRCVLIVTAIASGTVAVTVADGSAVNQAGNTTMTFNAAGDMLVLESVKVGSTLRWQILVNEGSVALS